MRRQRKQITRTKNYESVSVKRWQQTNRKVLRLEALESRCLLAVDLVSVTPGSAPDALFAGLNSTPGDPPASQSPMISGNGRFVAFHSKANNLVETDTNDAHDVFVRDLELGVTTLISSNVTGTDSGSGESLRGASVFPTISDDGRYVTFTSFATDLVDENSVVRIPNVYVQDRDPDVDGIFDEPGENVTRLLSIDKEGQGTGWSGGDAVGTGAEFRPVISANGAYVAFGSGAADLAITQTTPDGSIPLDANGGYDIIRAAVDGSTLEYMTLNAEGTATPTNPFGIRTGMPSISGDGATVAYESGGYDLVTTVPDAVLDWSRNVFVSDGGPSALVSVNTSGDNGGDRQSKLAVVSRDGEHVAFISLASDLAEGVVDDNSLTDVYVRDLKASKTTLVSRSGLDPTVPGDAPSPPSFAARKNHAMGPAISGDGRVVVFTSGATNLLDPSGTIADENLKNDIYAFDRDSDGNGIFDEPDGTEMILVSVNDDAGAAGEGGFFGASNPTISANGRFIAFATDSQVITGEKFGMHVYVRDMLTETTYLVSPDGSPAGGPIASGGTADFNISISNFSDRVDGVAFVSLSADMDPKVSDTNGSIDVFAYTPPTDITLTRNFATGTTVHSQSLRALYEDAEPFELGYYRSTDRTFGGIAEDELLGVVSVSGQDASPPASGTFIDATIGSGPAELALPGITQPDTLEDYFVLAVADHTNTVEEFDGDPFNEDNLSALRGLYHLPGEPLFVHGEATADEMSVSVDGGTLAFNYGPTNFGIPGTFEYKLDDVSEIRVRLHEGNDFYSGSELRNVVFGGAGGDKILGGQGNDFLDGGEGNDSLSGGEGDDVIFDGMGDDTVDVGSGDDIVVSTPGSDDIFIDGGGVDTLDFSFADNAIEIDLELDIVQNVDVAGNTIQLDGDWENILGSVFDDEFSIRPRKGPRVARGGDGHDILNIDAGGLEYVDDGTAVSFPNSGFGDITYSEFEELRIVDRIFVGDANKNGTVDFADFLILSANFGSTDVDHAEGDFDGDNSVDFSDFLLLSQNFGRSDAPAFATNADHATVDQVWASDLTS